MAHPPDIMRAAEAALDKLLCNCVDSCGGHVGLRTASINDIAEAIAAEREACARIAEERFDTETSICKHCGEPIALRNPSGHCDHLFWPDNLSAAALVANGLASNADEPIECHQDGLDYELRVLFGGLGCRVVAQADDGSRLELPYMSADQARVLAAKLRTAADELDVF